MLAVTTLNYEYFISSQEGQVLRLLISSYLGTASYFQLSNSYCWAGTFQKWPPSGLAYNVFKMVAISHHGTMKKSLYLLSCTKQLLHMNFMTINDQYHWSSCVTEAVLTNRKWLQILICNFYRKKLSLKIKIKSELDSLFQHKGWKYLLQMNTNQSEMVYDVQVFC